MATQIGGQNMKNHNKASQSDLRKLSSFLQKDAKKQPIHSGSCWRRYAYTGIVLWKK